TLRFVNVAAVVRSREIDIDVAGQLSVFVADHGWPVTQRDTRDLAERNLHSGRRPDQYSTQRVQIVPIIRQVTNIDRIALAPFDGCRDILAAHAGADRALNGTDGQAVPRGY